MECHFSEHHQLKNSVPMSVYLQFSCNINFSMLLFRVQLKYSYIQSFRLKLSMTMSLKRDHYESRICLSPLILLIFISIKLLRTECVFDESYLAQMINNNLNNMYAYTVLQFKSRGGKEC